MTDPAISFTVNCVPPTVTSQMKGACRTPAGIRFFKKKPVAQAENTLIALLRPHVPAAPLEGPLSLRVFWRMPFRKSESKKRIALGYLPCDVRPDLSNLIKLLEDCMTTLRFWHDDGQIAKLTLSKHWASNPGFTVEIDQIP